ncbi:hypothetical protein OM076_31130 [Solirubrobacter ginsenosidimutans]|uniref:Uncharacterized protein n=1 Tax=Solirubrobacter ginsenosidimutans TaxID=490573 RepID=A0A9X3N0E0_9ACTN|nr:hypothetical protein [Solirubrobacter ginsenosidimutans]MDA0164763.1 hypothetical protein [Solirubrobacter ginsenosidimutans]
MGRGPLAVFVAVLAIAGLAALGYMTKSREVIASTPSAYTGLTVPLPVPAKGEACADEILFDTNAGIARFGATAPAGAPAPAIEVTAQGYPTGEYRSDYRSSYRVAGGWTGQRQLDVPLQPPPKAVFGTLCVRVLDDRAIDLVGTEDGRAFARPTVRVNGVVSPLELTLRLMEPGRHSYLSRLGQMTTHASTLKPFGAWWMWVLALALLVVAPLGVWATIRTALATDAGLAEDRPAPMGPIPSERVRRWYAAVPVWGRIAVALAVVTAWLFYWGLNTHVFQNDEDQYVYLSRWLWTDFPRSLWNFDVYGRGLQRLEVWMLALPAVLTDSPWSLALGRLLNAAAFVSTAIPVYLIGRILGLRPRWAALPALLSAVVPWAVVTTALLTENLAYPAFVWVLYTTVRTTLRPSPGNDVLALVAILVAGLSRSALLALAPMLPLTVLATSWRCGSIRTVLRDHVVLWGTIAVALVAVVPGLAGVGPTSGLATRLAGGYGTPWNIGVWTLVEKSGRYFSRIVTGTGFFAAAAGVPWLAVQLARTRDPARFAFSFGAVVSALLLFYALGSAGPDERYIVYLAPLVLLPAVTALALRELTPLGLGIGSVLAAALVLAEPWQSDQGPFMFFIWPAETFYARTAGLRLDSWLPGDAGTALAIVGLALGLAGVAVAMMLKWAPARLAGAPAVVLVAAVALSIPLQANYALSKHVDGAGSRSGPGLRARAFVDSNVPHGATVGELALGVGQTADFTYTWQEVQFYNQRVKTVFAPPGPNAAAVPPGDALVSGVEYDDATGLVRSPRPLTDYMVVPTQPEGAHLAGDVVASLSYIPVALLKVAKPARMLWRGSGFALDGTPPPTGGDVRVYGRGTCAGVGLAAPAGADATWRIEGDDGRVSTGTIPAGKTGSIKVPLPQLAARGYGDLKLTGTARVFAATVYPTCA